MFRRCVAERNYILVVVSGTANSDGAHSEAPRCENLFNGFGTRCRCVRNLVGTVSVAVIDSSPFEDEGVEVCVVNRLAQTSGPGIIERGHREDCQEPAPL